MPMNRKIGTISKKFFRPYEGIFKKATPGPTYIEKEVTGNGYINLTNAVANHLMELKAYGGTEQRNLSYTQLEYIQGSGTQYIDTGIKLNQNNTVEVKYCYHVESSTLTSGRIFGARYSSGTKRSFSIGSNTGKASAETFVFGQFGDGFVNAVNNIVIGQRDTYKLSADGFYVNDIKQGDLPTATFETPFTVKLFAFEQATSSSATPSIGCGTGRCKEFKVLNGDTLVMDLIPARNTSNVIGMYDLVSGQFFANAGTGTFTAGPDVVPTPTAPIDIVSNNGVIKVRHQSGLPLGYKKLLSIYNSTSATLDTGIKLSNTDRVETRFFNSSSQYGAWYGIYATGESSAFYANGTYYGYDAANNKVNTGISVDMNGHDLVHDFVNGKLTIDGNDTSFTPFEFTNSVNNKLFCRYYNNSYGYNVRGWLAYYKVYRNNVLIQDLVPCTRESDNTVGMYDMVSGTFIGPDEGYTFEEGTAATDPIEVYVDGTTETIWSHGKNLWNGGDITTEKVLNGVWERYGVQNNIGNGTWNCRHCTNIPAGTWTISFVGGVSRAVTYDGTSAVTYAITTGTRKYATVTLPTDGEIWLFSPSASTAATVADVMVETGSTATTYEPYYNGGTATAEMLLKVGTYQDEQEILSGNIARKVGIKVFDGTESWIEFGTTNVVIQNATSNWGAVAGVGGYCTHLTVLKSGETTFAGACRFATAFNIYEYKTAFGVNNITEFKQFLADQYNAGTPVIVVYPLNTPTTESVAGQTMHIPAGNSTIEITQASIDNLGLYAKYKATE